MQDLFMTQMISAKTTNVSSKRTPQSEFQSRDDAAKKDFMDAIQNAISSEEADSAPEKAEQPKDEVQKPAVNEKPVEQQAAENSEGTDSAGNETIIIPVDPSYTVVFPDAIAPESIAAATVDAAAPQVLTQNALGVQVQTVSTQTAPEIPVQQSTEQTAATPQAAFSTVSEQSAPVKETAQSQTPVTTVQNAPQTNAEAKMQPASEQTEGGGKASLTNQKGAETVTDGSLVKAQQTNPDTIFVKVGENGVPKEPSQLTSQLGEKIQMNFTSGRQEFDIQLNPQELGNIHIKMSFNEGKVTVLVHCSNPETQQLLAANAGQLREVLENNTGLRTEVMTSEEKEEQEHAEKEGENQAREEQKDRQKEQHYHSSELELSAFLQKFRLGMMEFQ